MLCYIQSSFVVINNIREREKERESSSTEASERGGEGRKRGAEKEKGVGTRAKTRTRANHLKANVNNDPLWSRPYRTIMRQAQLIVLALTVPAETRVRLRGPRRAGS